MGTKNSKKKNQDNKSVSSVYEHSLSSNSDKNKELQQNKDNRQDIINEFKEEIQVSKVTLKNFWIKENHFKKN